LVETEFGSANPGLDSFSGLFSNLELHRLFRLPLQDYRSFCDSLAVRYIPDPQLDKVAAAKFAIYR
jgi:hypothetical protein